MHSDLPMKKEMVVSTDKDSHFSYIITEISKLLTPRCHCKCGLHGLSEAE